MFLQVKRGAIVAASGAFDIRGGPWRAVLRADQAAATVGVAREVADRLRDRDLVESTIMAAPKQTGYPDSVHWQPHKVAEGYTGLALVCGYLDACFPDEGWDATAHEYLVLAARGAERHGHLPVGLYGGLSGLGFAAWMLSRRGTRYRQLLSSVEDALLPEVVELADTLYRQEQDVSVGQFDVISGLGGVGAYLLFRQEEKGASDALRSVLRALVTLTTEEEGVPRWHTPAHLIADETMARIYSDGNLNLGLAHGIPGPLALMALALRSGVVVDGLAETVNRLASWLGQQRIDDAWGANWPTVVPLAPAGPDGAVAVSRPVEVSRTAWCYGSPGIARALWLAGEALDHPGHRELAVEAMQAVYSRPLDARRIDSPTFCHGVAGLLQITLRFAQDSGKPLFTEAARELGEQLRSLYEPDSLLGYRSLEPGGRRVDQPGLLEGAPGVDAGPVGGGNGRRADLGSAVPPLLMGNATMNRSESRGNSVAGRRRRSAPSDRLYEPLDWALVRAPLLPVETYLALGGPPDEDETGEGPTNPYIFENGSLVPRDPHIRRALAVGSADLLQGLERSARTPRKKSGLEGKLRRYLIRMSTRPTPYGLFAGVAMVRWGETTDLTLADKPPRTRSRPDMEWLLNLVFGLEARAEVRRELRLFANSGLLLRAGRAFLAERAPSGQSETAQPVSLRTTGVVRRALLAARGPVPYPDLVAELLSATPGATREQVDELITQLWKQTVLLTDLRPPLTVEDPARYVADRLVDIPAAEDVRMQLEALLEAARAWDALPPEESAAAYRNLATQASLVKESVSSGSPIQTDMAHGLDGRHLAVAVGDEVARAGELLLKLTPLPRGLPHLESHRQAFVSRYGHDREVPLLELLDPDFGLGPPTDHSHDASGGLDPASNAVRHRTLRDLAIGAMVDRRTVVDLDEDTLARLETRDLSPGATPTVPGRLRVRRSPLRRRP